ncbi:MAG: Glycine-tRNA ligase [candidate division TM6 bacterium GW2011_GWF2_32_72]|nr:MAG: Glycine-tRNA ligase [candidate division TM6 bacterium GW2011_GWF2_32_72]
MVPKETKATLDKLVALCKRKGFIFPSAEIYGGVNGIYDTGPLGVLLKRNIKTFWLNSLKNKLGKVVEIDGALIGPRAMWEASGHIENFHDPMIDCLNCKKRFRVDDDNIDINKPCPSCGKKEWTEIRQFNMMFKTNLGATADQATEAYLRPETAQAVFVNFKNVMSTSRVKIPFGIAQIGKSFRNEITPKQFLFRMREFEQMELEWFCKEEDARNHFDCWINKRMDFYKSLGLDQSRMRLRPHEANELAHYSTICTDVEYHFPFGWKELEGIAHRGCFDLSQHMKYSKKDLSVYDEETKESFIPNVVESSVGVDRLFLTILFDSYDEDEADGEIRTVLRFNPKIAPIKAAVLPLSKKLSPQAEKLFEAIEQAGIETDFDESGSIGKRYRRQDEIGTPFCITYDFESDQDNSVTIRDRDSMKQERISIDKVIPYLQNILK